MTSNKTSSEKKQNRSTKKIIIKSLCASLIVCAISFVTLVGVRAYKITSAESASPLTNLEGNALRIFVDENYADRMQILKPLPYSITPTELDISAESAILIDTSNGNILYEKNADEIIPPASMTKLFSMFVVDEEIAMGRLRYEDEIPLPPESWACNMMPHSSLMFLGKGQHVTVEELLQGLSVCSGNDAAYALAFAISGDMETFIGRMNKIARDYNLENTHFVESSGYSEENLTTAREMAAFANVYIALHPESLERFHGLQSFTYPKERNLADGDVISAQDFSNGIPEKITMPITQRNTNPLLGIMDGCDGLKTGYIDESGYNLSLTAKRRGTRFLSVTMKGPGNSPKEGNEYRVKDGTELMEWAFASFADYSDMTRVKSYFLRTSGGKILGLNLVPAFNPKSITVPYIVGDSPEDSVQNVRVVTTLPDFIEGGTPMGTACGKVEFILDDYVLDTVPLITDRDVQMSNILIRAADRLIYSALKLKHQIK